MSQMIIFTLGYFLGGVSSLVLMGLAVAARRGDSRARVQRTDEATPVWRERL